MSWWGDLNGSARAPGIAWAVGDAVARSCVARNCLRLWLVLTKGAPRCQFRIAIAQLVGVNLFDDAPWSDTLYSLGYPDYLAGVSYRSIEEPPTAYLDACDSSLVAYEVFPLSRTLFEYLLPTFVGDDLVGAKEALVAPLGCDLETQGVLSCSSYCWYRALNC